MSDEREQRDAPDRWSRLTDRAESAEAERDALRAALIAVSESERRHVTIYDDPQQVAAIMDEALRAAREGGHAPVMRLGESVVEAAVRHLRMSPAPTPGVEESPE